MTGIQLPINAIDALSAIHADITLGENWKDRRDAMARLLDARLNPHWAIDLTDWPTGATTWPTLSVSGFAGPIIDENGVTTMGSAWGPIVLADDDDNYIERTHAGVVDVQQSGGFTPDQLSMYKITTAGGEITAIEDRRTPSALANLAAALLALRSLTPAADKMAYYDSSTTAQLTTLTSFARTFLDDVDAAAVRTTLGIQALLDAAIAGLDQKASVRVATTAPVVIASGLENGDTIDGVTLVTGDRVLVKDQSSALENGIYVVPASGAATRSTDLDAWTEFVGAFVVVEQGTANSDTFWLCTANAGGTLGVTAVNWSQFGGGTVLSTGITDSTSAGRALLTAADAAAQRTLLNVAHYTVQREIGDGVNVPATGVYGDVPIEITGEIVEVLLISNSATSNIVLDIWNDTRANFPPTVAKTITASAKPTLTSANLYSDATLTGWTKTVTAGDILRINVDSVSVGVRYLLQLKIRRT